VAGELASLQDGDRWRAIRLRGQDFVHGPDIGAARARVPDLRREEFKEAVGGALADGGDEGARSAVMGTSRLNCISFNLI